MHLEKNEIRRKNINNRINKMYRDRFKRDIKKKRESIAKEIEFVRRMETYS